MTSCSRSGQLLSSRIPVPDFIPNVHYAFNEYLAFDLNITSILTAAYLTYYFILEPVAAVSRFSLISQAPVLIVYSGSVHPTNGPFFVDRHRIQL